MLSNKNQITSIIKSPQQSTNNEIKIEETKINSFISTDSTNDSNINIKKQTYIFENNNISYSISLILYEDKIKIKAYPMIKGKDEYYYEREFSHEELNKLNKVFKLCNNIEESYEYLNDLFKEKQNQINVYEKNDFFIIEKKMQLLPLYIEIPRKFKTNIKIINNNNDININSNNNSINNNNNIFKDLKILSQINNKNNEIKEQIEKIEDTNSNMLEEVKKKYLENEERYNKLSQNISIIDNLVNFLNEKKGEEHIKKINSLSLLTKKRSNTSLLSDISFNSNSNDNECKKNRNNLEKENFLKIFSDNNSVNSEGSNEKFFMKILKKKKLEKENNNNEKKQNNNNCDENNNIIYNKNEEENETYLYGDQDSSEEIKDDIDFFSNPSPSVTVKGPKNNNDSNMYLYQNHNNKSLNSLLQKGSIIDNNEFLFNKNKYENKIKQNTNKNSYEEIIKNDINSDWSVNNSYNMIGSVFERDSFLKRKNNNKIYKIFYKNAVECCNIDLSFGLKDKNGYSNIFSIDSKIISHFNEFDFIINYLRVKFKKEIINSIRIYRATEDGDKAEDFHRLCDGNTNILVLIKTKNGKKIGGYTSIGFNNLNQSILDDTAFIFSIDKREIYPNLKGKNAIDSYYNLGPTFSGDSIKIFDNFLQKGGITSKYGLNYQTHEDFQINDGNKWFGVEEIEVLEFLEMKIESEI